MKVKCSCNTEFYLTGNEKPNQMRCPDCGETILSIEFTNEQLAEKNFQSNKEAVDFIKKVGEDIFFVNDVPRVIFEFPNINERAECAIRIHDKMNENWGFDNTLVIVKDDENVDIWKDLYKKNGISERLQKSTTIMTKSKFYSHKFGNRLDGEFDLLVVDCIDTFNEEKVLNCIKSVKPYLFIGLCESQLSDDFKSKISKSGIMKPGGLFIFKMTNSQFNFLNITKNTVLNIINVNLDDKSKDHTIKHNRGIPTNNVVMCSFEKKDSFINNRLKYPDLNLTAKCTAKEKYTELQKECYELNKFANKYNAPAFSSRFRRKRVERDVFLSQIRTNIVLEMINDLGNKSRFAILCKYTKQWRDLSPFYELEKCSEDVCIKDFNRKYKNIFVTTNEEAISRLTDLDFIIILNPSKINTLFRQYKDGLLAPKFKSMYFVKIKNTVDEEYFEWIDANVHPECINSLIK